MLNRLLIVVSLLGGYYFLVDASEGFDKKIKSDSEQFWKDHRNQVADEYVKRLNLAIKGGDPVEICHYASQVVMAYNHANNEALYLEAKKLEKKACGR